MNEMNYYMPIVVDNEGRQERAYDLPSRLLKDRIILLQGEVNDAMASIICAEVLFLAAEDKKKPIKVYINSPGGSVTAGLSIYDCLRTCGCIIETYALGQACSMGAWLFAAGTKGHRTCLESARIMIHQVLGGYSGQATDIRIHYEETQRIKEFLTRKLAEFTGKDYQEVYDACERDNFMSAQESLEFGLCDKIL